MSHARLRAVRLDRSRDLGTIYRAFCRDAKYRREKTRFRHTILRHAGLSHCFFRPENTGTWFALIPCAKARTNRTTNGPDARTARNNDEGDQDASDLLSNGNQPAARSHRNTPQRGRPDDLADGDDPRDRQPSARACHPAYRDCRDNRILCRLLRLIPAQTNRSGQARSSERASPPMKASDEPKNAPEKVVPIRRMSDVFSE